MTRQYRGWQLPKQPGHIHTAAVKLAHQDVQKVIDLFKDGPKFMQDPVSSRTQARRDVIANAPQHVQDLEAQGYTQEFVHRLAQLMGKES